MKEQTPHTTPETEPTIRRAGERLVMPGMVSAHSHAFQRALRARTQRRPESASSFWSWRERMYELAGKIGPGELYHIARFAFVELAMSGVTTVGEFHYLHHQPDGKPYDDRLAMAGAIIRAAHSAGIRLTLIRTVYRRGGYGQALAPAQKRFADDSIDQALRDTEALAARCRNDGLVRVALAAHSIRAVPAEEVAELAAFARQKKMPFHMHVAEQRRELEECRQEYGATPVALLAERGVLSRNFVAVHATHVCEQEIRLLGEAGASVCLCRTTERDLGDGLPPTRDLRNAGARICVGVDGYASSDAFEEVRAIELDERSRAELRTVSAEAPQLLQMAVGNGHAATGWPPAATATDCVFLRADDPALAGCHDELLADAVIFGGTPRAVERVKVAGDEIVSAGRHRDLDEALHNYTATLRKLGG